MNTKQLLAVRARLKKEIADFTAKKNKEWGPALAEWEKANIPYKRKKVYELVENGTRRRGLKRFVIYTFQGQFMGAKGHMIYQAGGWWLDETDTPAKWDTMTVHGVSNSAVFNLSDNQKNNSVPKHLADRITS